MTFSLADRFASLSNLNISYLLVSAFSTGVCSVGIEAVIQLFQIQTTKGITKIKVIYGNIQSINSFNKNLLALKITNNNNIIIIKTTTIFIVLLS